MCRVTDHIAVPSRDDPAIAAGSEWVGGPIGRHGRLNRRWWNPVRIAVAAMAIVMGLGVLADVPCRADGWDRGGDTLWTALCYSDVPLLYRERPLSTEALVYRDVLLEYPVLTGAVMQATVFAADAAAALIDPGESEAATADRPTHERAFTDLTVVILLAAALVTVVATARTVPRRPWDPVLIALSPIVLLSATINWDLLAVALVALAVLAWTRERPWLAGLLIGLGAATKLYPILLLGPVLLVALRASDRSRALSRAAASAVAALGAWAAVNVPVLLWAGDGWAEFFRFNADRGPDFGSVWYAVSLLWPDTLPTDIDLPVVAAALVLLIGIVVLSLIAAEPPRFASLAFLAVAAFLLVNKVWSPQYSLWLLPLAVLARPRVRDLVVWQATEVVYTVAVWWYLGGLYDPDDARLGGQGYGWAILLRVAGLLWLAAMVVRDVVRPDLDPVRPFREEPPPMTSLTTTEPSTR